MTNGTFTRGITAGGTVKLLYSSSVKSFSSGGILPLQTTITFDGKGLFAGGADGVLRFLLGNYGRSR